MTSYPAARPRRSVLYIPGSNPASEKARGLAADALIMDLEDAVAPDAKETARHQIAAALSEGGYGQRELIVRTNGLDSPWGEDDLKGYGHGCRCGAAAESGKPRHGSSRDGHTRP